MPLSCGIGAGALDERRLRFHAHHLLRVTGERQGEIAEPAEQIQHPRLRSEAQHLDRARDQGLVDGAVHLDEVGRRKLEPQVKAPQAVVQRFGRLPERAYRVDTGGLQIKAHAVSGRETLEQRKIRRRRLAQHPQHERGRVVGDRDLDLRQLLADGELVQKLPRVR